VGRPSLYAVFGDKRAIFLRVLRAYAERKGAFAAKALLAPPGLRDPIAGFLRYAVESATEKGSARGCLLMCVAPLVNDAEVQRFLQNAATGGSALLERRFRDGISTPWTARDACSGETSGARRATMGTAHHFGKA
jgi:AcrR family transcriptional regulator